jgi:WD40 repeat protein
MATQIIKQKRNNWTRFILLSFALIVIILSYYQLFYKSPRIEGTIVVPQMVFDAHTAQVRGVRFSPDGSTLVSCSVDSTVKIWNKESGEMIRTLKHPQGVTYLDYSNDGNFLVTACYDGVVRLWRVIDGSLLKELKGHQNTVWSVAISKDGKTIASSGDDLIINLWDTHSGKPLKTLRGHKRIIWSVKFSPDNTMLASASYDASIKLWNIADGKLIKTINSHSEAVVDVAFSNSGKMLASTSDDRKIKLWSMPKGKLIRSMEVAEHVQAAVFSPDDKRLVTAGRDKPMIGEFLQEIFGDSEFNKGVSMRLWQVESGKLLQTFTEHLNDVNDVAYSKDGLWIASASEDKTVRLWRVLK